CARNYYSYYFDYW
nr:immunoglobulin heavy chain junction region [Mus musculus]MBK4187536.1 immunoglobulin heavy chain junction region [Mus musculus]MBK4187537.1 immunoglobulin heavy chain junction region [Mus musculus]